MKPLVFDLFCGLGGWSEAFIAEGYDAIGFDIEAHDYGNGGYPGELVLCDVRQLKGAELVKQYGIPACIIASPPCQEFSYMAMPWSKAKEKRRKILSNPEERKRLTELFRECFRIQREVSDAAARYIPLVVENVRGAQEWVGRSRWNFGSFHLWGDVPALMPIPAKMHLKIDAPHLCFPKYTKGEGNKTSGMNWSDQSKRGQDFTRIAGKQAGAKDMKIHMPYSELKEGLKGYTPNGEPFGKNRIARMHSSKSKKRKQASAEIAKIPPALALWIARVFKPHQTIPSEEKLAKSKGV